MSFSSILGTLNGQKWSPSSAVIKTADLTFNACHNYSIAGSNSCGEVGSNTVYFDIYAFDPIQYEVEEDGFKGGDGLFVKTFERKDPYIVFRTFGSQAEYHALQQIASSETITFTGILDGGSEDVRIMRVQGTDTGDLIEIEVQVLIDQSSQLFIGCCGSLFDGTAYDSCDGTGEIPTDPACATYSVSISESGGTLTATTSGGPAGTDSFTWFRDGTQVGTGSSISANIDGNYQVTATRETCEATDSYQYQQCTGFSVTIEQQGSRLYASPTLVANQFDWYLDGVLNTTTGLPRLVIPSSGSWYVVATTASGCQATSNTVVVNLANCGWAAPTITESNEVLTVAHGPATETGTTYEWYYDSGDGTGLNTLVGETGATVNTNGNNGYYKVFVTQDGCTQTAGFLFIDDLIAGCAQFVVYIEQLTTVDPNTVRLQAAVINAPAAVTYAWYQRINEEWVLQGTNQTLDISGTAGIYRVEATSGECIEGAELYFAVDPNNQTPYQEWIGTSDPNEREFTVTAFTVPNTAFRTYNQIMAQYDIERNGVSLYYTDLANVQLGGSAQNDRTAFSFDFANNKIVLAYNYELGVGDRLTARQLYPDDVYLNPY